MKAKRRPWVMLILAASLFLTSCASTAVVLPFEIETGHGDKTFPRGADRISLRQRSTEWHEVGVVCNERQECFDVVVRLEQGFVDRHERVALTIEIDGRYFRRGL